MNFDYAQSYPSARRPVFARNLVATSQPLAAQAGLRMLARGGNAVDAAVAAAAAIAITEPCSNGLGSDAFCIVWDGKRLHGLNASGRAPAAWTPEYFRGKYGAEARGFPLRGWDTVTVPGAVSAWMALSERFGKLPFADLLEPAIDLAERGYAVPAVVQQKWALAAGVDELVRQPGFAATFLPHGRAPLVGELFRMPGAARALRAIAATQGEAFYRGEIAQAICAHARQHGGSLVLGDLENFKPEWVRPISRDYRGYTVHELPPNGQGIAALMALGMLSRFDLAALPVDGPESQHLQIEAMKLAFADTYRHVAEPGAMEVTPQQLLSDAYLAERARCIDPMRAQEFGPGNPPKGGTIYLSAADERGMMVSFIQSNYMGFGSGVVVPGFGLSLQNRGVCFSLDPASPNVVGPGKRPFHTIIPGMLTRLKPPPAVPAASGPAGEERLAAHEALMSFGVMGGNMQPQGHLQTLVRMLDHAQNPQAACDAPRWRFDRGLDLSVEPDMDPATVQGLLARGHRIGTVADSYMDFGSGQFIWRLGDPATQGYVGASDSRRDGLVAGF
jgi:gamma-glutamyltranspeptidase/glutathione hydrolase